MKKRTYEDVVDYVEFNYYCDAEKTVWEVFEDYDKETIEEMVRDDIKSLCKFLDIHKTI